MSDKLPDCVQGWLAVEIGRTEFVDGSQLLVALAMDAGHYEYHVVRVHCDEGSFWLEGSSGELFGWDIAYVDFYVVLSQ